MNSSFRVLLAALLGSASLATQAVPGALDPTFGTGGKRAFDFSPAFGVGDGPADMVQQPDGKLLVSSHANGSGAPFFVSVSRHLPDGGLDTTFGIGGRVAVDFGGCITCYGPVGGLELRPDGSIVVAAQEPIYSPPSAPAELVLNVVISVITPTGAVDTTFGTAGVVRVNVDGITYLNDIAIRPDGAIMLAGSTVGSTLQPVPGGGPPIPGPPRWMVTRLTPSGAHDAGFHDSLASLPRFGHPSSALKVALQSDGHVIVAGDTLTGLGAMRYTADGSGAVEFVQWNVLGDVTDLVVDATDRIWMIVGRHPSLQLQRFQPDGTRDLSYHGQLPTDVELVRMLLVPSGDVYVTGSATFIGPQGASFSYEGIVLKLDALGDVDASFADLGRLALQDLFVKHVLRQSDGRLVGVGVTRASIQSESGPLLTLFGIDPAAKAFVTTEWLGFPLQSLGTRSAPQAVTVTNVSASPRTIAATTSADFQVAGCSTPLAAGASCTLQVTYRPTITQAHVGLGDSTDGTLTIGDGANGTATARLHGTLERSLVQHFYRSILRREPDPAGSSFWNSEANRIWSRTLELSGATFNSAETTYAMAMAFFGSAEYTGRGNGGDAYITDLYRTFFDRVPDAAGLDFWRGQLAQGLTREGLLTTFMFSAEFNLFNATYLGGTPVRPEVNLVMDMYRGLLGRLPDSTGLMFWAQRLQTAQCFGAHAVRGEADALSALFLQSDEYAARGRTNAGFLDDLYNALMRRGPDVEGYAYWKSALDQGVSRDAARQTFLASPEFGARVEAVVGAGCRQ